MKIWGHQTQIFTYLYNGYLKIYTISCSFVFTKSRQLYHFTNKTSWLTVLHAIVSVNYVNGGVNKKIKISISMTSSVDLRRINKNDWRINTVIILIYFSNWYMLQYFVIRRKGKMYSIKNKLISTCTNKSKQKYGQWFRHIFFYSLAVYN